MRFYENRYKFFAISIALIIVGIVFIIINGVQFDIQFKGGAILKYSYEGTIDLSEIEAETSKVLNRNVSIQEVNDMNSSTNMLVFNMSENKSLSVSDQQKLDEMLAEKYSQNKFTLSSSNTVEPFIGKRFLRNGIIAIVVSSILIVIYVWIRFKAISGLSAGVMALVALLHDCIMVFMSFVIFNIPINESFVAVILTIIGYSVNDTIIIYDRIRENAKTNAKMPLEELVNKSITQSMSRSINTCGTTLASTLILFGFAYAFGISSIVSFALPMAVGLVSGCYSTICIAGPLWTMWKKHNNNIKPYSAK